MTRLRLGQAVIAAVAASLGVVTFVVMLGGEHNVHRGAYAALALASGWGFIATGLYVSRTRPRNKIAALMIALGFSCLLKALAFSNDSVFYTIGSLSELLLYAFLIHLLLSFPTGRLESRVDRLLVIVAYINAAVLQAAAYVMSDPASEGCASCPANPLLIGHSTAAKVIETVQLDVSIALLGAVVAVLYRRWRYTPVAQQRAYSPVLAMGSLTFLILMSNLVIEQAQLSSSLANATTLALFASFACLPFAFVAGLMRYRFVQASAVSSLVSRLGDGGGPGTLRAALAEALGDTTLQLAYWVSERSDYVDEHGHPAPIDPPPKDKIVTLIEHEGRPVAALVHVTDLADEHELLRNVGAAAALTLENDRLDTDLRAKLVELRASRTRIVQAGDEQRRRIERNLHDGAQQRLMALGINLRLARERVEKAPGEAVELIDESLRELSEATAELRELARGIHPAVLTERGLTAAITGLAGRSPVPVRVLATPNDRLPSSVESAIYFIVAEALTNAGRYADAQNVTVSVARLAGDVMVKVADDGVGGAALDLGSGLRGLQDRVAALDGELTLTSTRGAGTTLNARLPCV